MLNNKTFVQGNFANYIKNKGKYLGDVTHIIYRSSWELEAFKFCDNNPNIIKWASEEIKIPYVKPNIKSGKAEAGIYVPDLFVVKKDKNDNIVRELIEIKPYKQTQRSKARKPLVKQMENYQYVINQLKWEAAKKWCEPKGILFRILTEKSQFK